MQFTFDWNPDKAKGNFRKHKVSFDRASSVFRDPNAVSIVDEDHSEYEERWLTMGIDSSGIVLIVSHTFKTIDISNCTIRLISTRKAEKHEIEQY